MVSTGGT